MPKYVKTELENDNKIKAIKEFTDREKPRKVFWNQYEKLKNALDNKTDIPIQVIYYYGIGGIGKTSLLQKIRDEIKEQDKKIKYTYLDYDKLLKFNNNTIDVLKYIESDLKDKYKFQFPLFDLAFYQYEIKQGKSASKPELKKILEGNDELNFLLDIASEIPLVGTFYKIFNYANAGQNILRNKFKDSKLEKRFINLDNDSSEQLEKYLPYYFAQDMKDNLKKEKLPFVFMIDTYDKLVNELTDGVYATRNDDYLRDDEGLILNIPNVLWVMAGREKLKWELEDRSWVGTLDQHLLGDLSEIDSTKFLKNAGITEDKLIHQIYKLTSGSPMYLDMCVDTYYKFKEIGKTPNIKDFSGDTQALVKRFFEYMNDQEKDFVTMLAFISNWTDDTIERLSKKILGTFSYSLYDKVKDFSFIVNENGKYKINNTIKKIIVENASPLIKQKFYEEQVAETNEEIEKIINNREPKKDKLEIKFNTYDSRIKYKTIIENLVYELNDNLLHNNLKEEDFQSKIKFLWEKIQEFDENFFMILFPELFDTIINNSKKYKKPKEYMLLESYYNTGLRVCSDNKHKYYEKYFKYEKWTFKDFIKQYEELKKMETNKEIYMYPLTYMISYLLPEYKYKKSELKDSYKLCTKEEAEAYQEIFIKEDYTGNIFYLKLLLLKGDLEEFYNKLDDFKYSKLKNKGDNSVYLRLLLEGLNLEFKGEVGSGYLFNPKRIYKTAREIYEDEEHLLDTELQKEENIKIIGEKLKQDFINRYVTKILDILNNVTGIITVATLGDLMEVISSLADEDVSDESSIKLFSYLLSIADAVLETNSSSFILRYQNTIYRFSDINNYSLKYRKQNKKAIDEIANKLEVTYDNFYSKCIELYGANSDDERLYIFYKAKLLTEYFSLDLSLDYLKNIKDKYGIYSYFAMMTLDVVVSAISKKATEELLEEPLDKLRNVFDNLFNYYEEILIFSHENPDNKDASKQIFYLNYDIRHLISYYYHLITFGYSKDKYSLKDIKYYEERFVNLHDKIITNYKLTKDDLDFYCWLLPNASFHLNSVINTNMSMIIPITNKAIKYALDNNYDILELENIYRYMPFFIVSLMCIDELSEKDKKYISKVSFLSENRNLNHDDFAVDFFTRATYSKKEMPFEFYLIIFMYYAYYQHDAMIGYDIFNAYSSYFRIHKNIKGSINDKNLIEGIEMLIANIEAIDDEIKQDKNKYHQLFYYTYKSVLYKTIGFDKGANNDLDCAIKLNKRYFYKFNNNKIYLQELKESFYIFDLIKSKIPNSSIVRLGELKDIYLTYKD